ncbi:SCO2400 family protein [Streptomyces sp. NPDC054956]
MNYCPACRRHLNGALACAGCGTPAEYLIPAAPAAPATVAGEPAAQSTLADVYADSLVVLSVPNERRAGARRRATHRRRRRAVLGTGLGLLLATVGSLAVARMADDGQRSDRAATVVLTDDGPKEPDALPSRPGAPAPPSAPPSGKAPGTAKATAVATKTAGPGSTAAGSPAPGLVPSASVSGKPGPGTPGPGGTASPTGSGQPAPSTSGTSGPPGTPPQPTPKPSKTCVFWIFGCS